MYKYFMESYTKTKNWYNILPYKNYISYQFPSFWQIIFRHSAIQFPNFSICTRSPHIRSIRFTSGWKTLIKRNSLNEKSIATYYLLLYLKILCINCVLCIFESLLPLLYTEYLKILDKYKRLWKMVLDLSLLHFDLYIAWLWLLTCFKFIYHKRQTWKLSIETNKLL